MRLRSIRIKNFRSITRASRVPLDSSTVLIGPNNEGKTNVLRALVIGTRLLVGERRIERRSRRRPRRDEHYIWERDFPVQLQPEQPSGESEFILDFDLTPEDERSFKEEVGSSVTKNLPIRILIGPSGPPRISVYKKGPGGKKVSEKKGRVAEFVRQRFELEYIPAVRTATSAREIVQDLVSQELRKLEDNQSFRDALGRIAELQQPVLEELSRSLEETLKQFLPAVTSVDVQIAEDYRYEALRSTRVYVDDGTSTELRYKGDGVQSLAALALMRHASFGPKKGQDVLVAIEEPESHLHPNAIHELHAVLEQLAETQQVVITTHCPLFVDRKQVSSNIVVQGGRARPAKSIAEIRDLLGVRASDNLRHAQLVLVVEGDTDRVALEALLGSASRRLGRALAQNRLAIDPLGGASKLAYKLGGLRDAMCSWFCIVDDDEEGRRAIARARDDRLLKESDYTLTKCAGLNESEFEDLIDPELVSAVLAEQFSVMSSSVPRRLRSEKWSRRMKHCFEAAGKDFSRDQHSRLKIEVAQAIAQQPRVALMSGRRSILDNLVSVLEDRLTRTDA